MLYGQGMRLYLVPSTPSYKWNIICLFSKDINMSAIISYERELEYHLWYICQIYVVYLEGREEEGFYFNQFFFTSFLTKSDGNEEKGSISL